MKARQNYHPLQPKHAPTWRTRKTSYRRAYMMTESLLHVSTGPYEAGARPHEAHQASGEDHGHCNLRKPSSVPELSNETERAGTPSNANPSSRAQRNARDQSPRDRSYQRRVKAKYSFDSEEEGELPLLAGTKVDVLDGRDPA